jgi:hypothetical protein
MPRPDRTPGKVYVTVTMTPARKAEIARAARAVNYSISSWMAWAAQKCLPHPGPPKRDAVVSSEAQPGDEK